MSHTGTAIWTGFGPADDPAAWVYFRVERDDRADVYPDWEPEEFVTIRHIPGSDDNDIYLGGFGPEGLTLTLRFDDRAAYARFRALRHTTGTLRLINGFTSIGGTTRHLHGVDYIEYADVLLRAPRTVVHLLGGSVRCEATFVLTGEGV